MRFNSTVCLGPDAVLFVSGGLLGDVRSSPDSRSATFRAIHAAYSEPRVPLSWGGGRAVADVRRELGVDDATLIDFVLAHGVTARIVWWDSARQRHVFVGADTFPWPVGVWRLVDAEPALAWRPAAQQDWAESLDLLPVPA